MTGNDVKTEYQLRKEDISDVTDNLLVQWLDHMNQEIYRKFINTEPQRFIKTYTYSISQSPQTALLPSDFRDISEKGCGVFSYPNAKASIYYTSQTSNFTVGQVVTGASSGATGTITANAGSGTTGYLSLTGLSGVFQIDEIITDPLGGSATFSGIPGSDRYSQLFKTQFGQQSRGYYLDRNELVFTGISSESGFILRYVPTISKITSLSQDLQVPDEFIRYVLDAIDRYYEIWDNNPGAEFVADQRYVRALDEILEYFPREAQVYALDDYSSIYSNGYSLTKA